MTAVRKKEIGENIFPPISDGGIVSDKKIDIPIDHKFWERIESKMRPPTVFHLGKDGFIVFLHVFNYRFSRRFGAKTIAHDIPLETLHGGYSS